MPQGPGVRCFPHGPSRFLTRSPRAQGSAREGTWEVECLCVIPFPASDGTLLIPAYFWMIWASFEAPLSSVTKFLGGARQR